MGSTVADIVMSHSLLLRLEAFLVCADGGDLMNTLLMTTGWTLLAPTNTALEELGYQLYCNDPDGQA